MKEVKLFNSGDFMDKKGGLEKAKAEEELARLPSLS